MRPVRRTSRTPALVALVLVVSVVVVVGLILPSPSRSSGDRPSVDSTAGLGPVLPATGEESEGGVGYSAKEREALSRPLPKDAGAVDVPVLMYHYVADEPPPKGPYADGLTVRTPDFIEELEYLAENGYETVSLADAYLAMAGLRVLPPKPVVLTFDDGGLDNYEVAFPLLERYGFTGTFFVITKTVGAEGQMGWEQLQEMCAAGMSVQSHSVAHPDLTGVPDERLRAELEDSRAAITRSTGEPGYVFCYPAGSYDERVIAAVRAAGYVMAVATDKGGPLGPDSLFEIRRKRVQPFLPLDTFAALVR